MEAAKEQRPWVLLKTEIGYPETFVSDERVANPRAPSLATFCARNDVGWSAGMILTAAYVLIVAALWPLALQDYPAHLLNAITIADHNFHDGERFGAMFSFQFLFVPYLAGDFLAAVLIEALGRQAGGTMWVVVVALSLPLALIVFMRLTRVATERRPLLFILSLYLATDWFFLMGFLNFRVGVALTIVNLALAIRLREGWSNRAYVGYASLVIIGYLLHLSTIVFLTPALVVSGLVRLWRRKSDLRTECLLAAPLATLWIWHLSVQGYTRSGDPAENPYHWGGLHHKMYRLGFEFFRYHPRWDLMMALLLAICLLVSVGRIRLRHLREPAVLEMLLLSLTFVAVYIVLPAEYSEASFVDVRALAPASFCLVLAFASLPDESRWARVQCSALAIGLAMVLVSLNLIYLERHLSRHVAWLADYRAIVAQIPYGAHVFPIVTRGNEGGIAPNRHADAFITIDRGGLMPYAFTADTANPEKYLRYVRKPYRPDENWYLNRAWNSVDWRSVAREYDYVLIEKPFDARRVGVRTSQVADNRSAALLAIDK
jgi:hypothetical protein